MVLPLVVPLVNPRWSPWWSSCCASWSPWSRLKPPKFTSIRPRRLLLLTAYPDTFWKTSWNQWNALEPPKCLETPWNTCSPLQLPENPWKHRNPLNDWKPPGIHVAPWNSLKTHGSSGTPPLFAIRFPELAFSLLAANVEGSTDQKCSFFHG